MSTGTDGIPNQGLSGWGSNKHQGKNGLSKETNLQPRKKLIESPSTSIDQQRLGNAHTPAKFNVKFIM